MARQGTPFEGLAEITRRTYTLAPALTLIGYTNAQDSLGNETIAAQLVQPTQENGYAPIVLNGTWTHVNGVVTYEHPPGPNTDDFGNPAWFPSGSWSAPVTGVALIHNNNVLVHYFDVRDGGGNPTPWIAAAGKRFVIDIAQVLSQ